MSINDSPLAARIRTALADEPTVAEVPMFGGLSFLVDERLLVSAGADGSLLVRIDPTRRDQLLYDFAEASPAEMGGRPMGPAWVRVDAAAAATDDVLDFWIAEALLFNEQS